MNFDLSLKNYVTFSWLEAKNRACLLMKIALNMCDMTVEILSDSCRITVLDYEIDKIETQARKGV